MVHAGSSSSTRPTRTGRSGPPKQAMESRAALGGAHDASTDAPLRRTLERAMAPGCVALVLDLSEVALMAC